MNVAITGASGFVGGKLADLLLSDASPLGPLRALVLTDVSAPAARADTRVACRPLDLTRPGAADELVTADLDVLFHLAAVVSGQAEAEPDLALRVNFDATRALLEAARARRPALVLVLASTVGVHGPRAGPVRDDTAPAPRTTYGTAKAMSELLLEEYARRGLADARAVRLPTVAVRAAPNRAVTTYASGLVRAALAGEAAAVPVPAEQRLWLCGARTAAYNLAHAARLPAGALAGRRTVTLPGFAASAADMVAALGRVAGARAAARVRYEPDADTARVVASFPAEFDASRALGLGFRVDRDFDEVIEAYIQDDLNGVVC